MDLDKVFENRRSIRFFQNSPVDIELVKTIIAAGKHAPRASNRQHWEAVIVEDKELKEKLVKDGGAQRTVIGAPVIVVILVDMRYNIANYDNIQSASASVQNMLLKAVDVGLGSCWVVGFGSKENVRKILNIPEYFEPMCYILLGNKDEKMKIPFIPPQKKLDEVIHVNKYEAKTTYLPNSVKPKDWTLEQIKEHQNFVSRARHLGIDYDFYTDEEIDTIKKLVKENVNEKEKVLFLFGYDGSVLKHLVKTLENNEIVDCELGQGSVQFVNYKTDKPKYVIFGENSIKEKEIDAVIVPFTLEKIPDMAPVLKEADRVLKSKGKVIIFFKNKFSFYGLMYFAITRLLGIKKLEGFYIRSGPFEPVSIFKLKKFLKKNSFRIYKKKGMFFLPAETSIYLERLDGYLKRHGKKLTFFKHLIKPVLITSLWLFNITKWIKVATLSSSVCLIGEKK